MAYALAGQLPFDIHVVADGGLRTDADQARLYAEGRTTAGSVVTYAQTSQDSAHGCGLALDLAPYSLSLLDTDWSDPNLDSQLAQIGAAAKAYGPFSWGGDWAAPQTDLPHVELTDWQTEVANGSVGPGVIGATGNALGFGWLPTVLLLGGISVALIWGAYWLGMALWAA
jgi:hypothetical protein